MDPRSASFFYLLLSLLTLLPAASPLTEEQRADYHSLLWFKSFVDPGGGVLDSWIPLSDPCSASWTGVFCRGGRVTRILLPDRNLRGVIHVSITLLPYLRVLNLSKNHLHGELSQNFLHLRRLRRLDLSFNNISGNIPPGIGFLPRVITLRLEGNLLSGEIPPSLGSFSGISDFNVSGNRLSGGIPRAISSFPASSFSDNENLCGKPLPIICHDHNHGWSLSSWKARVALIAAIIVLSSFFGVLLYIFCRRKRRKTENGDVPRGSVSEEKKVVLFEGCRPFTADDLMKGGAEMLGRGSVGSTYRVVMEGDTGRGVAVKRLRKLRKDRECAAEIERLLAEISGLRHPNVVTLRGYYHSEDELLLVYDYLPNGSLRSLLHGNGGPGRVPLYWAARMKLALGAAQGVAFLHEASPSKLSHQKLNSSNILVDDEGNARVADFALLHLRSMARESPGKKIAVRSHESDVYSFGVMLLEMLTGRKAIDDEEELARWVEMVVGESGRYDWLDVDLLACKEQEDEMVGMLQVALLCLSPSPGDRPSMRVVSKMIEDIGERGSRRGRIGGSCTATSPSSTNEDSCYISSPISEDTFTFIIA